MVRYIDADTLLEAVKGRRLIFEENTPVEEAIAEQVSVFEESIAEMPTADVVPKSDVEGLQAQIEHLTAEKERLNNLIQDLMKG